jgi:hypothetical protein
LWLSWNLWLSWDMRYTTHLSFIYLFIHRLSQPPISSYAASNYDTGVPTSCSTESHFYKDYLICQTGVLAELLPAQLESRCLSATSLFICSVSKNVPSLPALLSFYLPNSLVDFMCRKLWPVLPGIGPGGPS